MILSDGYGTARSWCKEHGELLPDGVPVRVPLQLGECGGSIVPPVEKLPPAVPPSGPGLPTKIGNIRPALAHNDITGYPGDVLELNVPPPDQSLHHNEARPLLVKMQPGKPDLTGKGPPRPPLQPFHLQGPPGAWNIVTSRPGSLPPPIHVYQSKVAPPASNNPNTEGIEVQFGPRLPLPPINPKPLHHFPPRRRPVTKSEMSAAESETSVTLTLGDTEQQLAVTERVEGADVIVIETADIKPNMTGDNEKPANQSIKPDILSSEQVTIFKVGPDNDIVRVSNDTQDNNVTQTETESDYKFVILHKLPNGNALNLENLKTYNYEDLIKGHSSVIEDSNREEMLDRENLEFFDVPRRVSNDKAEPYIIYHLPAKTSDHQAGGAGGGPVYRRPVRPVYKPRGQLNETTDSPVINRPKVGLPPVASTNDWIPTNRKKSAGISLDKLTELSQLAQVSINNQGPIRVSSSSSSSSSSSPPQKLNVQLLPSRLSAVLSHLDTTSREREDRERLGRAGPGQSSGSPGHRQNKISPAFQLQPLLNNIRDRMYGRKIHSGYVVTQPYQTQVIPSSRHKYIPLASHHLKKPLWWQPPVRPHQLMRNPHHHFSVGSAPLTVPLKDPLTNHSQSDLLASNHSDPVSGPVTGPVTSPVYIIELNETSQNQNNNNRSLTMTSPEELAVTDFPLVHFNETAEKNITGEITTEQSSNQKLEDLNLKNESSQNLQLQSRGNLAMPDTIRSKSVNKWINDSTGKHLQELSPASNITKLRSSPASGMVNHSQE